jgi:hypothetical protein
MAATSPSGLSRSGRSLVAAAAVGELSPKRSARASPSAAPVIAVLAMLVAVVAVRAEEAPVSRVAGKSLDEDWSALLPDLLPGIRLCVSDSGVPVATVPLAAPMNHGLMLARLVDTGGNRHDCVVEMTGDRIDRVDAVRPGEVMLPREGTPVFLPAREPPPAMACGRLERVLDAVGKLAGWLHYPC